MIGCLPCLQFQDMMTIQFNSTNKIIRMKILPLTIPTQSGFNGDAICWMILWKEFRCWFDHTIVNIRFICLLLSILFQRTSIYRIGQLGFRRTGSTSLFHRYIATISLIIVQLSSAIWNLWNKRKIYCTRAYWLDLAVILWRMPKTLKLQWSWTENLAWRDRCISIMKASRIAE